MKKSLSLSILLACLMSSSVVLAAEGTMIPKCKSFAFNMAVVNDNVSGCPGQIEKGSKRYCLYSPTYGANPREGSDACWDVTGELFENSSDSLSYAEVPQSAYAAYEVGYCAGGKCGVKAQKLRFSYKSGVASANCAEVFGSDVKCTITNPGTIDHPLYTLTISKP